MEDIKNLNFDDKNFNKHTEFGMSLLEKSLRENGAGRSILLDKDNNIIAGNGIVEAAGSIGLERVKVVETTGDEIVAVKRMDISLNSRQGRQMALADNATSMADLAWDDDTIKGEAEKWGFDSKAWGVNPDWKKDQTEYQDFVDKFKPKLTTDDCYTPPEVFEAVEKWVRNTYKLGDVENIRPFKPGGDYQAENYVNKVVIDNPPFSILAEIIRFYVKKDVKFFLFAPLLTIFNTAHDVTFTRIIANVGITYENGAVVLTNFVTNMDAPENTVRIAGSLRKAIENAQPKQLADLGRYRRPKNVQMVADLGYGAKNGSDYVIKTSECHLARNLDGLRNIKKSLYGGGLLVNDGVAERAAAERAAAERAAAERAAAERAAVVIELSEREQAIVDELNAKSKDSA